MDLGKNESKRTQTCNRSHWVTAAKMPRKMNKTATFIMLFAFFLCGLFVQIFAAFSCHFVSLTLWYICIFLKWFCISLWLFFFTFLKLTFLRLWVFCASFANRWEFLDSRQPLCNNSYFPVIFFIVVLSLLSVFCSFAVIFDHFVVLVEYFYVTFGSFCGRFTHHFQPIFHNILLQSF